MNNIQNSTTILSTRNYSSKPFSLFRQQKRSSNSRLVVLCGSSLIRRVILISAALGMCGGEVRGGRPVRHNMLPCKYETYNSEDMLAAESTLVCKITRLCNTAQAYRSSPLLFPYCRLYFCQQSIASLVVQLSLVSTLPFLILLLCVNLWRRSKSCGVRFNASIRRISLIVPENHSQIRISDQEQTTSLAAVKFGLTRFFLSASVIQAVLQVSDMYLFVCRRCHEFVF